MFFSGWSSTIKIAVVTHCREQCFAVAKLMLAEQILKLGLTSSLEPGGGRKDGVGSTTDTFHLWWSMSCGSLLGLAPRAPFFPPKSWAVFPRNNWANMKSPQEQHCVVCVIVMRMLLYDMPWHPLVALLVLLHDRDTKVEKRPHSWQK